LPKVTIGKSGMPPNFIRVYYRMVQIYVLNNGNANTLFLTYQKKNITLPYV